MKLVALTAIVAALAISTTASGATPTLVGVDGPGFTITLTKGGKKVTKLTHGTYVFKISDKSGIHNFHLTGPGVNKKTGVKTKGSAVWTVTLRAGTYTYRSDATKKLRRTFKVTK